MAQSSQPQSIAVRAACLRVVLVAHRVTFSSSTRTQFHLYRGQTHEDRVVALENSFEEYLCNSDRVDLGECKSQGRLYRTLKPLAPFQAQDET